MSEAKRYNVRIHNGQVSMEEQNHAPYVKYTDFQTEHDLRLEVEKERDMLIRYMNRILNNSGCQDIVVDLIDEALSQTKQALKQEGV